MCVCVGEYASVCAVCACAPLLKYKVTCCFMFSQRNGISFPFLPSPFKQLSRCQGLDFDLPTHTHTPPQQHTITVDHLTERLAEAYTYSTYNVHVHACMNNICTFVYSI